MKNSLPKGLLVSVYRDASLNGDCSNGGVSSKFNQFLIVGKGIPEIFSKDDPEQILVLTEIHYEGVHYFAKPYGLKTRSMAGGNFIYTSDSRFRRAAAGYPIPIHDRVELPPS